MNGQVGDGVKEYAPGRQREGDRWTTWESLKKDGGRERKGGMERETERGGGCHLSTVGSWRKQLNNYVLFKEKVRGRRGEGKRG